MDEIIPLQANSWKLRSNFTYKPELFSYFKVVLPILSHPPAIVSYLPVFEKISSNPDEIPPLDELNLIRPG